MFRVAGIVFVVAILFAGCATAPQAPEPVVEPLEPNNELSSLNWTNSAGEKNSAPQPFQPSVVRGNLPPPKSIQPAPPVTTWMPLSQWASAHHLAAPRRLSDMPVAAYAIGSKNGTLILELGSLDATWNGTAINLGFAPQIIDGEVSLHGLDLEKNLAPLLCDSPLKFPSHGVIVIDPGHGGGNSGTHSVLDGRFEKEFTLDWALRLQPLLETNGWTVFLTRTNDTDVSLSNRVVFAEEHHADFFISLHFNSAAPDEKQAGLETYCMTPSGMPSTLSRGFSDNWSQRWPNNSFDPENLQFAVRIQSALAHQIGMEDRGVRRARFIGVLRGQKRPAILIEGGYLSNRAEAKLIESAGYRQKLAEAIAAALNSN